MVLGTICLPYTIPPCKEVQAMGVHPAGLVIRSCR